MDGSSCIDCRDGDVRLVGGTNPREGRVEVCYQGVFYAVCDDFWDELDAGVVCGQLGYLRIGSIPVGGSHFTAAEKDFLLDDLKCTGSEQTLLNCSSRSGQLVELFANDCNSSKNEDAGVRCEAMCSEGDIRLAVSEDIDYFYKGDRDYNPAYYDKDGLVSGRVEVCVAERYGSVCQNNWTNLEASVTCRQLGFSRYGAIAVNADFFNEGSGPVLLNSVTCSGNETSLLDCAHVTSNSFQCPTSGAVCQDSTTVASNCVTGELRLQPFSESTVNETREGLVEICINNAWGTVCDNLFDSRDAAVACAQLGGFKMEGDVLLRGRYGEGVGPIFLSYLDCLGSESNLLTCRNGENQPPGLHSCQHSQDVAVRCFDVDECASNNGGCNQTCSNSIGSYNCSCMDGYLLNEDGLGCDDIDECTTGDNDCDQVNGICTNTIGHFLCSCRPGYTGNGTDCRALTCADLPNACPVNARCLDDPVSGIVCECLEGYQKNGSVECININECLNPDACDTNAICTDNEGNFTCECGDGFEGNGQVCEDINECSRNLSMCHPLATCNNTEGNYTCFCNSGYTGDGFINCTNINECQTNTHDCDLNAYCTDTMGGFNCTCSFGYRGTGQDCECLNGEVRLMNGSLPSEGQKEGRVEICYNNTYGTVCDDFFDDNAARVVCGGFGAPLRGIDNYFGSGLGPITLDNVVCEGGESDLLNCTHNNVYENNCDHSEDVGVVCNISCIPGSVRLLNRDAPRQSELPSYDLIKDEVARGTVIVCVDERYGTICDDSWDNEEAAVVCKQLGFSAHGAVAVTEFYTVAFPDTVASSANCTGRENMILDCSIDISDSPACADSNSNDVGVVCAPPSTEVDMNCKDGQVRLVNGSTELEGRLEVCINHVWGTVCSQGFSEDEAEVVCSQLQFQFNGTKVFRDSALGFGEGTGPIFLQGLTCSSTSNSLLDCADNPVGVHMCDHSLDTGVRCIDFNQCAVNNGNCSQNCNNLVPGHSCSCWEGFQLAEDNITCTNINECSSLESPCHPNATCMDSVGGYNCSCNNNFEGNGFECTLRCMNGFQLSREICVCEDGNLRLVNNNQTLSSEGRVEVCINNTYGTICGDFWDEIDAQVVCQELGYSSNGSHPVTDLRFGSGEGPIFLSNFHCSGEESTLFACPHDRMVDMTTCNHSKDVGVRCQDTCSDGDVRLCVEENDCSFTPSQAYLIDNRLSVGRVEVCIRGTYGTICDDSWNDQSASVICRQLEFSPNGAIALRQRQFSEGVKSTTINSLNCIGNETAITDCQFVGPDVSESCGRLEDAEVVCQDSRSTLRDDCVTGSVRLVGSEDVVTGSREGRLEVCINNAWGTVCDNSFSSEDANTACDNLGTYSREDSLIIPTTSTGTGPIYLDQLACTSSDTNILECQSFFSPLGLHMCTHLQDVSVRCKDINECEDNNSNCEQLCNNTIGSYFCSCEAGFRLDGNGLNCSDISECDIDNGGCEQECNNFPANFNCSCFPGYELDSNGFNCSDINECAGTPCHMFANCTNLPGSFSCSCMTGFSGDGSVTCSDIDECQLTTNPVCDDRAVCNNMIGSYICTCNRGYQGSGRTSDCYCRDGEVQLMNGTLPSEREGRVEICKNNTYGAVCNLLFDELEAQVVCNGLGFSPNGSFPVRDNRYGRNEGPYQLDGGLICKGTEADLLNCTRDLSERCEDDNSQDAGVRCASVCEEGHVRILIEDEFSTYAEEVEILDYNNFDDPIRDILFFDAILSRGRVEICVMGKYRSVCANKWRDREASVVCRELGLASHGAIGLGNNLYLPDQQTTSAIQMLSCNGTVDALYDCIESEMFDDRCEIASVVCQDPANEINEISCNDGEIKLVNGSDVLEGRVEVCINNAWGTICSNGFDDLDARVICKGVPGSGDSAPMRVDFGKGERMPIFFENLACQGEETSIINCGGQSRGIHKCTHELDVGVHCPDKNECDDEPCANNSDCTNGPGFFNCTCMVGYTGDGSTLCEDILECSVNNGGCEDICIEKNGSFSCKCNTPGFEVDGKACVDIDECQSGTDGCNTMDNRICKNIPGSYSCICKPGYQEVDGACIDINECEEANDCQDICINTEGSFQCMCTIGFQLDENGRSCSDINECSNSSLNNCGNEASCTNKNGSYDCTCKPGYTGNGTICVDIDECASDSTNDCDPQEAQCENTNGSYICHCSPGYAGNGFTGNCTCTDGAVRLVNNRSPGVNGFTTEYAAVSVDSTNHFLTVCKYDENVTVTNCSMSWEQLEGRVEICLNNSYGTICDDRWDALETRVVCGQFGFSADSSVLPIKRSTILYGLVDNAESVRIYLDDLDCSGNELNLFECPSDSRNQFNHVCDHTEDAGVQCGAECTNGSVRIIAGDEDSFYEGLPTPLDESFYINDELASGRIEICEEGVWRPVCRDIWDSADASVACSQLGFSRAGAITGQNQQFQLDTSNIRLYQQNISCSGNESSLAQCPVSVSQRTQACTVDAYIACQDPAITVDRCKDWEIRLSNGSSVREGRVELCINNAWGTICDDRFSIEEAIVVCNQMNFDREGARAETLKGLSVSPGYGLPIYLTQLSCLSSRDMILSDCLNSPSASSLRLLGLTGCSHEKDAVVHCEASCEDEIIPTIRGNFTWRTTYAENTYSSPCQYGPLSGQGLRYCNEYGNWNEPMLDSCYTYTESLLKNITILDIVDANLDTITKGLESAVIGATTEEDQSVEILTNITDLFQNIENCTVDNTCQLNLQEFSRLVSTVDALQTWQEDTLGTLSPKITRSLERLIANYTQGLSLTGDQRVTNITFRNDSIIFLGLKERLSDLQNEGVKFTVGDDVPGVGEAGSAATNAGSLDDGVVSIRLPPELFKQLSNSDDVSILFNTYESAILFPISNETRFQLANVNSVNEIEDFAVASSLISATVIGQEVDNLPNNTKVTIVLKLASNESQVPVCVYWDENAFGGRGDWSSNGCNLLPMVGKFQATVVCECDHLSTFGVFVNTQPRICEVGFKSNPSATSCTPIKPEIGVEVDQSDPLTFSETQAGENKHQYTVEIGHQFSLLCISTGNFSGEVTWYKVESGVDVEVNEVEFIEPDKDAMTCSGSGFETQDQVNTSTSNSSARPCPIILNEKPGQLYAYRKSRSEVLLGTRQSASLGVSIGIDVIADGTYQCIARNAIVNNSISLSVMIKKMNPEHSTNYIRFSTQPYDRLVKMIGVPDNTFVDKVFSTALLSSLNGSKFNAVIDGQLDSTQHEVSCNRVQNRLLDVNNNLTRVECRVRNFPRLTSNSLVQHLESSTFFQRFQNNLPAAGDGLVQDGTYIVSANGFCEYEVIDTQDNRGLYIWSEATVGEVVERSCVYNNDSVATRLCANHLMWNTYDGKNCITRDTFELLQLAERVKNTPITAEDAEDVINDVSNIVSNLDEQDEQSESNLELVVNVYEQIDSLIESGNISVSSNFTKNTVGVLSDVSSWPPEVIKQRSSSLVYSFEAIAENLANQDNVNRTEVNDESLSLLLERGDRTVLLINGTSFRPRKTPESSNKSNYTAVDVSISLPPEVFNISTGDDPKLIFTSYINPVLFQVSPPDGVDPANFSYEADSVVLGFAVANTEVKDLNNPVNITLQSLRAQQNMDWSDPICVSWVFNMSGGGNWAREGCSLISMNRSTGEIKCQCSHLTNFAVLVNVNAPVIPALDTALTVLTIIGGSASIIGLVLTIFSMLYFKKLRDRDATKFHIQLCLSILLMMLVFLIGVDRDENEVVCTMFSVLILYFTLASVFWMGAEAMLMGKKLVFDVFGRISIFKFTLVVSLLAWGVPILFPVIGLSTLATRENYLIFSPEDAAEQNGTGGYCFISDIRLRYGVFLVPLIVVLIFNTIMFILVIRVLIVHSIKKVKNSRNNKDKTSEVKNTIKTIVSIISVMIMFGLSWFFGALSVDKASLVFQVLFVICNTSQGFLLFVFFCIVGSEAREEWKNLLTCSKKKKRFVFGVSSVPSTVKRDFTSKKTATTDNIVSQTSNTMKQSVGLLIDPATEQNSSTYDNTRVTNIELSQMSTNESVNGGTLLINDEKTDLDPIINNDQSITTIFENHHTQTRPQSHLPPHIMFRFYRPYFNKLHDDEDDFKEILRDIEFDTEKEVETGLADTNQDLLNTDIFSDLDVPNQDHDFQNLSQMYLLPVISEEDSV